MSNSSKLQIIHDDGQYPFVAAEAYDPGDVVIRPDGTFAVMDGIFESTKVGDLINPRPLIPGPYIEVDADPAITFAAEDVIYYNKTTKLATNVAAGGLLRVGVAPFAKAAGAGKIGFNAAA